MDAEDAQSSAEERLPQRVAAAQQSAQSAPTTSPGVTAATHLGLPSGDVNAQGRLMPLWWVAAIGLGLCALAILIYSMEGIRWIGDASSFLTNGDLESAIAANGARRAAAGALLFYYIALLVSGVCFIIWFRAAYKKLELAGIRLRFSRGWAIGSWLVPFLNLVRPKKIANDIWRGSHVQTTLASPGGAADIAGQPVSGLVHWWWGLWLVGNPLFGIGVSLAGSNGSPGDSLVQVLRLERSGFYVGLIGAPILLAAGILAAVYAWQVSHAYDARFTTIAA